MMALCQVSGSLLYGIANLTNMQSESPLKWKTRCLCIMLCIASYVRTDCWLYWSVWNEGTDTEPIQYECKHCQAVTVWSLRFPFEGCPTLDGARKKELYYHLEPFPSIHQHITLKHSLFLSIFCHETNAAIDQSASTQLHPPTTDGKKIITSSAGWNIS